MKLLTLLLILVLGAGLLVGVETPDPAGPNGEATPMAPPATTELSTEDQAMVQRIQDDLASEMQAAFPTAGDPSDQTFEELLKRYQAHSLSEQQAERALENSYFGRTGYQPIGSIPFLGIGSVDMAMTQHKPTIRADRLPGPSTHHQIMSATDNVLDNVNRKLKSTAAKLSKYACGQFDWVAQLKGKFNAEALKNYVTDLSQSAIAAAPMALLATWSPTLYEIVKWLRMFAGMEVDANAASCQVMEAAMIPASQRMLRGPAYADCMRQYRNVDLAIANKNCASSGPSPFDGVEGATGEIRGLQTENDSVDLVDEMSSFVMSDSMEQREQALAAADANVRQCEEEVKLTEPGPRPTDPAELDAWTKRDTLHRQAERRLEEAKRSQAAQISAGPGTNTFDNLRYAIGSNMRGLLGNLTIRADASVQIGNQPQIALRLRLRHSAYKLSQELTSALREHFGILVGGFTGMSYSTDDLNKSYWNLEKLCHYAMSERWIDSGSNSVQPFDASTLDKMAFLIAITDSIKAGGSDQGAYYENTYRILEHINNVTHYEVYRFSRLEWEDNKDRFRQKADEYLVGSNNSFANLRQVMDEKFKAWDEFFAKGEEEWRARVRETLPYVNGFKIPVRGLYRYGRGLYNYGKQTATVPPLYTP